SRHAPMQGNGDIRRFMILGWARTGSTFLLPLLLPLLSKCRLTKVSNELFNLERLTRDDLLFRGRTLPKARSARERLGALGGSDLRTNRASPATCDEDHSMPRRV